MVKKKMKQQFDLNTIILYSFLDSNIIGECKTIFNRSTNSYYQIRKLCPCNDNNKNRVRTHVPHPKKEGGMGHF